MFVRSRSERGDGPLKIRYGLRERGVDDGLIDAYLVRDTELWMEAARAQRDKRFGEGTPRDQRERARQARFLQGRGFPGDVIRRVLNED